MIVDNDTFSLLTNSEFLLQMARDVPATNSLLLDLPSVFLGVTVDLFLASTIDGNNSIGESLTVFPFNLLFIFYLLFLYIIYLLLTAYVCLYSIFLTNKSVKFVMCFPAMSLHVKGNTGMLVVIILFKKEKEGKKKKEPATERLNSLNSR